MAPLRDPEHGEPASTCRPQYSASMAGLRRPGRAAFFYRRPPCRSDCAVRSQSGERFPATFLAKMRPPAGIIYKRITSDFFVVSSIRNDRIWYNRCNRGNGTMNCVLINYPAAEKRRWDGVVTRISHTLRG